MRPSSGISSAAERGRPDAERAHAPDAVGADERRQRVQPGPEVARGRAGRSGAGRGCRRRARARSRRVCDRGRPTGAAAASSRRRGGARPEVRCIRTTSSQRSNFQPRPRCVPVWREAERPVHADRAAVGRVADHGQHLARAGGLAAREQLGEQQAAEAAAGACRRRGRSNPRGRSDRPGAAGTGWRRRSRRPRRRPRRPARAGPWRRTSSRRRAMSARSAASSSKVPVPWRTCQP